MLPCVSHRFVICRTWTLPDFELMYAPLGETFKAFSSDSGPIPARFRSCLSLISARNGLFRGPSAA